MERGRQTVFNAEQAALVCEKMAEGLSIRQACEAEGMPNWRTVYEWYLDDREGFAKQYERAKELQLAYRADEIIDISDDGTNDWMARQRETKGVTWVENAEAIARSKLRVETRKWILSKLMPKKYGDKLDHTVGGELTVVIQSSDADL